MRLAPVVCGVTALLLAPACDPPAEIRPPDGYERDGGPVALRDGGAWRDAGGPADAAEILASDAGEAADAASVPDAGPQAHLSGTATLWGAQNHSGIRVELTASGQKVSASTDATGRYAVDVSPGTWAARFTFGNYFPQTVSAIDATHPVAVTVLPVELRMSLRLAEDDQARVVAVSPDESHVVHERNCVGEVCELWIWGEQDGVDRLLGSDAQGSSVSTVQFTPDGKALLFMAPHVEAAKALNVHFLASHTTQKLADSTGFTLSPDGTWVRYWADCGAGGCDLMAVDLVPGATPRLLCPASSGIDFADDWKHALCVVGPAGTLRLWDLTRWTSVDLGVVGAGYSTRINDDWTRLLLLLNCSADNLCDLESYDAATGTQHPLAKSASLYNIEVDSAWTRAVFIRNAVSSGFEVSGELAWADLSTGVVSAIDSGVGRFDISPDATKALYFKSWTGQDGDLWVWDGSDGDKRRLTNPASFEIGTSHSNDWAYYTPRRQPGWPDDLEVWNYKTRTTTFLGTYAWVWATSRDGNAAMWIDGENAQYTAGTLHLYDATQGKTLTMGVGVGHCNGKFMDSDDGVTWAVFSGKCNAQDWDIEQEMYAWSRTGGSRFLGKAQRVGLSPDKTKVAYLATDASGVSSLRLWDGPAHSETVVATGLHGEVFDSWSYEPYIRFNGDWSRVAFWGGCSTTPCDPVYTVMSLPSSSAPLGVLLSKRFDDWAYLNDDFAKAVTVVGDPATVTGFDLTTGVATVYAQGVDPSWGSYCLSTDGDRLLVNASFEASTSTGELRYARVGDPAARTVLTGVSPMMTKASSDWSAAFFYTDMVAGTDGNPATGRFWSARLPAAGAIRPLPVEDHALDNFYDFGKWKSFRVVDPQRGGLYITKGP